MDFKTLELLYMRRIVMDRIGSIRRTLDKNRRYYRDDDSDIEWQQKMANLEAEIVCLASVKERINMQLAETYMLGTCRD